MNQQLLLEKLKRYQPQQLDMTPIAAAVMVILLTNLQGELEIVITKRATSLPTYAGHYSFPGGMKDATDDNLYQTATREVEEELHVSPKSYSYITQLDDFHSRDGDLVRPFVTMMRKIDFEKQYQLSTDEIAEIFYLPVDKLKQIKDEPRLHAITRRRPSYVYSEDRVYIWGLTASILIHLSNIISDQNQPLGKEVI